MNDINPLTVVLYVFAVARLTHLLTTDSILDRPRDWMEDQGKESPQWNWLHTLATCPWCAGWWLSAAIMAALALGLPDWALAVPAASYVTGWLEMTLGAMDGG